MKGIFDAKEVSLFTSPLTSLSRIIKDGNGIILNISKDNKNISIYSLNSEIGVMVHMTYNAELFKNIDMSIDERIGILNIPQLVKYFQILDGDKVDMRFENNVFFLANTAGTVSFKTADPDMMKEAPKNYKGSTWFIEVKVDQSFQTLIKAISVLGEEEDCIVVKGNKEKGKVLFTVRSSGLEINSYKLEVSSTVNEDFETFYRKDVFEKVLTTKCDSIGMAFSERVARFECKSPHCDITYYLAKKQVK